MEATTLDTPDLTTFAARVRWARLQRDLSQAQLAERVNVGQGSVSTLESGRRGPSHELSCALAVALEVSLDWLALGRGSWEASRS